MVETGEVLMSLIAEMDHADATDDPENTIRKVNDDISIYMDKFEFSRFTAVSDLKPVYLDKEANLIEINQWIEQFQNYIKMGYRNNPPATGVSMHLGPLLHSSWRSKL